MRRALPLLIIILLNCAEVLYPAGSENLQKDYERALRRVERRKSPSHKQLKKLFQAYDAAQEEDYRQIGRLVRIANDNRWPVLYNLYERVRQRMVGLAPYRPLNAPANYRGGYSAERINAALELARTRAADYYLAQYEQSAPPARRGDKQAARDAHCQLTNALDLQPENRNALEPLLAEMRELGTVRIGLYFTGAEHLVELARSETRRRSPLIDDWFELYYEPTTQAGSVPLDLEATVQLTYVNATGLVEQVRCTNYSKEVLDYVEEKKVDVRINDSTTVTRIEKIEHFKTVTGTVREVEQSSEVRVYGELVAWPRTPFLEEYRSQVEGKYTWSNDYEECSGDRRALPTFCSGIRSSPPSDAWMLSDAMDELVSCARYYLERQYRP